MLGSSKKDKTKANTLTSSKDRHQHRFRMPPRSPNKALPAYPDNIATDRSRKISTPKNPLPGPNRTHGEKGAQMCDNPKKNGPLVSNETLNELFAWLKELGRPLREESANRLRQHIMLCQSPLGRLFVENHRKLDLVFFDSYFLDLDLQKDIPLYGGIEVAEFYSFRDPNRGNCYTIPVHESYWHPSRILHRYLKLENMFHA